MVLFGDSVVFVGWTSPLQDDACMSLLLGGEWNKQVYIKIYLHDTAARVLMSGHPPETITRVLTYGHSPGPLNTISDWGLEGLQTFTGTVGNGNRGVSSGEQGLRNNLRERIGLLKRFVYCKC